jgi:DNA-binding HxlR family transcriptional regulator
VGEQEQPSAIGQALLLLGDHWILLMLQRTFLTHTRRFAGWRDELGMSESVLSRRLRELVAGGVLRPSPYREEGRTRTEYRLTDKALELWPLLVQIWSWEYQWGDNPDILPKLVHRSCGHHTGTEVGCTACGAAPVTARDTEAHREPGATFSRVAVPRHHRRTTRDRFPQDPLSRYPQALGLLGDRWSTTILAAAFLRVRRFGDFQAELGVAPSVLIDRLRHFTELDVLTTVAAEHGWHEYRLTRKGLAFFGIYAVLVDWAQRWYVGPADSRLHITHRACGQQFVPFLRCQRCREPLVRTAVYFEAANGHRVRSFTQPAS